MLPKDYGVQRFKVIIMEGKHKKGILLMSCYKNRVKLTGLLIL